MRKRLEYKGLEYKGLKYEGCAYQCAASWRDRLCLRLLAALVVALAAWLLMPKAARADWSVVGDTVPSEQVIDNDVLATGTDVRIDGTINGDLLAIGSTVTVNGPVSGSLVAVGRTVVLNGDVGGSTYVLGRTLKLGEMADVLHNVHFAGLLLDSRSGSRIGRDLVAASLRGHISSQVGRALNAFVLLLTFNGRIGGGIDLPDAPGAHGGAPLLAGNGGLLLGVALGPGDGPALHAALPIFSPMIMDPMQQEEGETAQASAAIPEWLVSRLSDLLILLLLGGLVLWSRPALIQRPAEWLRRKPLPALGFGLLAVAVALNAVVIFILLVALLLIVGIWLGSVTLWTLAFILWGIGFPALLLACALFVVTVLYGSKVIVADLVGSLILKRLAPKAMEYRILPLLLGLVLYVVLRSIPILGWAIEGIVTILGLGAIWVAYRHRRSAPQAVGVDEQAQPALALAP
jgi:cytoskeletal protein CcmA (bactofilin family)